LPLVVYEAGPTGYSLARTIKAAGLPVGVVAPSKTPRQAAPDSKTDSLDARKLAEYAAKGLLRHIAIPTKQKIKKAFSEKPICTTVKILTTHPGVGPIIATRFATEIFNPKRFRDKTQPTKYAGLAPSVHQSGQSLRDGPILKTGRPQLRCNLIQGAWAWIRKDADAYKTYCRLVHNTGHQNKAITAMARKLAIHLWMMACENKPYDSAA